jgi:hypothetical protein
MKSFFKTTIFAVVGAILASAEVGYGESFIFPEQGQSQVQQTQDLNECNKQAREQTDFDPAKPPPKEEAPSPQTQNQRRERIQAYNQALAACLKARGYSIRSTSSFQ